MQKPSRRDFVRTMAAGATGALGTAWLAPALRTQAQSKTARVVIDRGRTVAEIDPMLWGSFLEHLGRAVYGGVYEPGSPLSDANGFRKDVVEEMRTLKVPTIRYPGGNFVSGYNWLDGVGPKDKRPRVRERAWSSIETNQFGTNEFIQWCRLINTEPLLAVNLGTGTQETAAALVEYCNVDKGTRYADLRREHGFADPHNVRYWCLGNEMDGPWQIGHMTAREYGRKAVDTARQIRSITPGARLIACGSSGPGMATYLDWDREILEESYELVDGISLHRYFNNAGETEKDSTRFVAMNLDMERQIQEIIGVCDYVRRRKRSPKTLWLSFDEWNVWYRERSGNGKWQFAPRLLEEIYNLEDALVVGGCVNTLLRQAKRVRVACLAQIINVIAPIMTSEKGLFRQTIYYPYSWALKYAQGRVLDLGVEVETYNVPRIGDVPYVDAAGAIDPKTGECTLLVLNRDLQSARDLEVAWHDFTPARVLAYETLTGNDLKAANGFEQPTRVAPEKLDPPRPGARMTFKLPPRSYTVVRVATT